MSIPFGSSDGHQSDADVRLSGSSPPLTDVDQKQEAMLVRAADAVVASLHLTRPRASLQAFAAGVPVVTPPNELWASRITYGFYQQMGINDLIAISLDEYVALAVKLATDAAFHKKMVQLIKRNRSNLSEDGKAVREWETFFDFAADQIFQNGDDLGRPLLTPSVLGVGSSKLSDLMSIEERDAHSYLSQRSLLPRRRSQGGYG